MNTDKTRTARHTSKLLMIKKIWYSSAANIILLPLIMYNTIFSIRQYVIESRILLSVINSNDEFAQFLLDSQFGMHSYITKIYAIIKKTPEYNSETFIESTKRHISDAMGGLLESNDLLGVAVVKIRAKYIKYRISWFRSVKEFSYEISLEPATLRIVRLNIRDLCISIVLYSVISILLFII